MKKIYFMLTSILISLLLIACTPEIENESKVERFNLDPISTMHTYIDGHVYAKKEQILEIQATIEEIFEVYHKLTDNFKPQGDVKGVYYINQQADLAEVEATVEIEKELYDLLDLGIQITQETDGYFDMTMGKVIKVWKDLMEEIEKEEEPFVTDEQLQAVYSAVDSIILPENPISLSKSEGKYYVTLKHGALLDLGAIAKGYAVQKVVEYLESEGIESYLISGGSSSIVYGKNNPRNDKGDYVLGFINPVNKLVNYALYHGQSKNVTTSGSYEQYFVDQEGNWYHHIISPKTRRPANNFYTLTVIGNDAGLLDGYSTALFCMTKEEIENFLKDKGIEAVSFNLDKTITTYYMGSGFELK